METQREMVNLNPKHRSEDVVDYYFGDLEPELRAEFEKHLETCVGCQKALKTARVLFPAVDQVLAIPKRKTTDELVAMMMRKEEELHAEDLEKARHRKRMIRRTAFWAGPVVAAAAAASMAAGPGVAVVEMLAKLTGSHGTNQTAAPPRAKKP
jgi:anti-sigma-K factor RskA